MVNPIFIPSKDRVQSANTINLCVENGLKHYVFVEPKELEAYKTQFPNSMFISIEKNSGGIVYVRNFMLDYAIKNKLDWVWVIDDDLQGFFRTEKKKCLPITMRSCLTQTESLVSKIKNKLGIFSLEYGQYAWSAEKNFILNSYCEVCVCLNVNLLKEKGMRYDVELKEDRDMCLQVIANGYKTLRACKFSFKAPKNGSNKGGLSETYAKKTVEADACLNMVKKWDCCEIIYKNDNRCDLKINWKAARLNNGN